MWDKCTESLLMRDLSTANSSYYHTLLDNANNNNSWSPEDGPVPSTSSAWQPAFTSPVSPWQPLPGTASTTSSFHYVASPLSSPDGPVMGGIGGGPRYRPLGSGGSIGDGSSINSAMTPHNHNQKSPTKSQSPFHCPILGLSCPYAQMLRAIPKLSRKVTVLSCLLCCQGNNHHGDEEGGTTDTATTENSNKHEKDSGVGRTDDSTKDNESSEQELADQDTNLHCSNDSFTSSNDPDPVSVEDVDKFRQVLENRCLPRKDSQSSIEREIAALNQEMEQIQLECQEIVDMHAKEQSRMKTSANVTESSGGNSQDGVSGSGASVRSPRLVPRMGTRLDYIRQLHALQHDVGPLVVAPPPPPLHSAPEQQQRGGMRQIGGDMVQLRHDNTSSAYNTGGESCRSTPLTLELHQHAKNNNSVLCLSKPPPPPLPPPNPTDPHSTTEERDRHSVSRMSQTGETLAASAGTDSNLQDLYAQYADVMYTNRENLQHTIMVQQKLFQQQLIQKQQSPSHQHNNSSSHSPAHNSHSSPVHNSHNNSTNQSPARGVGNSPSHKNNLHKSPQRNLESTNNSSEPQHGGGTAAGSGDVQMEYVVKRRADGSRYIARRPIRNKLLKERARKIHEERAGLTTDDDAMSEMKIGRYWNKMERKKHFEKARQRKEKSRAKMDPLKEQQEQDPAQGSGSAGSGSGGGGGGGGSGKMEPNIVELGHRKMMRHKGKKVFDDFTTIQEMMVHGARDPTSGKAYNPLLSVTTV